MVKCFAIFLLSSSISFSLWAQGTKVPGCPPDRGYEPVIVANPERKVTFHCSQATAFELIQGRGLSVASTHRIGPWPGCRSSCEDETGVRSRPS
jgi:hypothetical protein